MNLLNQVRFPNSSEPIGSDQFVRKWLTHIEDFTGIHDRRICIMGTYFFVPPRYRENFNNDFRIIDKEIGASDQNFIIICRS